MRKKLLSLILTFAVLTSGSAAMVTASAAGNINTSETASAEVTSETADLTGMAITPNINGKPDIAGMTAVPNNTGKVEAMAASVMTISDAGIKFIEGQEGFSAVKYSSSSYWYIGYGTRCGASDYPNGITQSDAETLLKNALASSSASVNGLASKNGLTFTQAQFDALVSFTYNLGAGWMAPSNRIYDYLVGGISNYTNIQVVNAIGTWCHVGNDVSDKLVSRRLKEANIFLYGEYTDNSAHAYNYVIYNPGNGSVDHDIYFYPSGAQYGTLPTPTLSGQNFSGWYTSTGALLTASDKADSNKTVHAVWSSSPDGSSPYSDVKTTDWFYSYVSALSASNVISGYPDCSFRPGNTVSCGEALKLILLTAGNSAKAATGSHWASGYLDFAVSKGFVGSGEITDLDAPITRLLSTQIAARALGVSKSDKATPFADTSDGYVVALYNYGVIQGSNENGSLVFKPDSNLSRAEMSAIVWRMGNSNIHENQIHYNSYWVNILGSVPVNAYDKTAFAQNNGIMSYKSDTVKTHVGIDVSEYQGDIDWAKVKASGIEYAIIRVGYRGSATGKIVEDAKFEANIKNATAAGMKIGVYFFSQAISSDEASEEADFVLSHIKGYQLDYPAVFDWEPMGKPEARAEGLSTETVCGNANTFCGKIAAAGFKPMVYFNSYAGYIKYDLSKIINYDFWYAEYSDMPSFYYNFQMWQYSSTGSVSGITGNVDMDICFKSY